MEAVSDAQPTDTELEVYLLVDKALEQAENLLSDLSAYRDGATEFIRKVTQSLPLFRVDVAVLVVTTEYLGHRCSRRRSCTE